MDRRARRCLAALVAPLAVLCMASACVLTSAPRARPASCRRPTHRPTSRPAARTGSSPSTRAAAAEGVGPMNVSESSLSALPIDQQMLTVVNEERVDRGLPPIDYITSQLDAYAQAGANGGTDPSFPSSLTGGPALPGVVPSGPVACRIPSRPTSTGSTTTAGVARRPPTKLCTPSNPSECWGHRDIILHEFANCPSGPPVLSMGAAYSSSGYDGGSLAAIFVSSCQAPSDVTHLVGPGGHSDRVRLSDHRDRSAAQWHGLLGG